MKLLDYFLRWLGWQSEDTTAEDEGRVRVERLETTVRLYEERLRKAGLL